MTDSVTKRAREAQQAHFAEHGDMVSDEVQRLTAAIYDGIDGLNTERKTLLIREALSKLHVLFATIASAPSPGTVAGLSQVGNALCAIGAYAVESEREKAGFTSTGDTSVDDIINNVKALVSAATKAQMSPEQIEAVEGVKERVLARVQAGEEFDAAFDDEVSKVRLDVPVSKTTDEEKAPSRYSGDGLYL